MSTRVWITSTTTGNVVDVAESALPHHLRGGVWRRLTDDEVAAHETALAEEKAARVRSLRPDDAPAPATEPEPAPRPRRRQPQPPSSGGTTTTENTAQEGEA